MWKWLKNEMIFCSWCGFVTQLVRICNPRLADSGFVIQIETLLVRIYNPRHADTGFLILE
jgi:hypothetical protein